MPSARPAIERERGNRHDERRHLEARDDEPVDEARERANEERKDDRERQRKAECLPRIAEHDRAEADDRADREIDAAGDDDKGHRERDETDLGHQPALIQEIVDRKKAIVEGAEADERDHENDRQQRLVAREPPWRPAGGAGLGRDAHFFHPRAERR
jgi:hypothetical protein